MTVLDDMLDQIENLRSSMILVAEKYGYNHEKTITISRELDQLLNVYEKEMEKQSAENMMQATRPKS